ncbi:MAG: hypothetical protein HY695_09065 [Deltaproteobacteria bacterium]|nr:hypothetical protein [Deltaproteobacteria bacterium]
MRDAIQRHKWVVAPVGIFFIGAILVAVTLVQVRSGGSANPPDNGRPCNSTVCETAAGPINILPASQKARLTVHNISDIEGMVVMSFIDGLTGEVLSKSEPMILRAHQGAFFDFESQQREIPAVQLVGGVRFSRMRGTQGVTFGATLQVIESDGRTGLFIQLPTPGPLPRGINWTVESNSWEAVPIPR